MRRRLAAIALVACGPAITDPPPVSTSPGTSGDAPSVDVFVGTTSSDVQNGVTNGAGGSTNPAAALPFGMVQWGPDTPTANPAGYDWNDTAIAGFSVTHVSGAGCNAMRDFPIFPVSGAWDASTDPEDVFSHDAEIASPGFYEVILASGIRVDLTATQRTGLARFTFPHDAPGTLLVAASRAREGAAVSNAHLAVRHDGTIVGQRTSSFFCGTPTGYTLHFAARFDRAFHDAGAYDVDGPMPGATDEATTSGGGLYFDFDTSSDAAVEMKIGLSYVSDDGAVANLDAENPGWDFDAVHAAAISAWNDALGHVEIEGGSADDRTAFYSALYHVLLQPGVASDVDGSFLGFDDQVHVAKDYVRYQTFSGWDIYRSWIQLVAAIAPDEASDIVRSLVEAGGECGAMPKWAIANKEASVMVGDPADPIVAGAWAFGARGFDAQKALALMTHAATDPSAACQGHLVRQGLADELARHWLALDAPSPPWGSASTTIEYALDDFSIAQFAHALGDDATHATFMDRAGWWKNVLDATYAASGFTGYIQPRDEGGAFHEGDVTKQAPLDITGSSGFVEGNATQYTFAVPFDMPGLVAALGGDAAFVARLDPFFTQLNAGLELPNMYIGNEPNFATPWAYDFVGAPWETQDVVRRILAQTFAPKPSGLPGNDDLGATSAWQAWAMLGMYPAIPAIGGVVLGSPTFTKATLTLAGGKQLVVTASGAAPDAPYLQSVAVNGAPTTSTWVDWSAVAGGGTIDFVLGAAPNQAWGSAPGDRPPAAP